MFVQITDKKNRALHCHTSLLETDKAKEIFKTFSDNSYYKNGSMLFGFWLSMEAVNRVQALKSKNFYLRAAIVASSVLILPKVTNFVFWKTCGNENLKKALDGAPVWEKKYDVPELDKLYFELEDENNYQPTLVHSGQLSSFK